MATVLYLVQRLPFPPNKGDKVRTHHVLRELASRHDVLLGTFVDDPADSNLVPELGRWCRKWLAVSMYPTAARARALAALVTGQPFTAGYYRHPDLHRWVREQCRQEPVRVAVVSCSGMAQYAAGLGIPWVMDFVDMDSRKWAGYGRLRRGPLGWLYRREARVLLQHDLQIAQEAQCAYFVSQREANDFRAAGSSSGRPVEVLRNGVDTQYFSPAPEFQNPYAASELSIVFTGTMDYPPNIDAATWFAREVLQPVRARHAGARLTVVGRRPSAAVRSLTSLGVRVTGEVADVRPWLQHAHVAVAPMRIARGVQNKLLEGLAMARAVVTAPDCAQAIDAVPGLHLLTASARSEYVQAVCELLSDCASARQLGAAGREHVMARFNWRRGLAPLMQRLEMFN